METWKDPPQQQPLTVKIVQELPISLTGFSNRFERKCRNLSSHEGEHPFSVRVGFYFPDVVFSTTLSAMMFTTSTRKSVFQLYQVHSYSFGYLSKVDLWI